mmetsp:Transcript_976/g.1275  ORF Transcript_976/g.1275 Transcript_976/m.1275 type:complete len:291 (-) Transcript_976:193-1065(-)|eukprot:CAMPEP_0198143396 /NCGR_PEP_ID=MMETSP1443-20131203/7123_1 /TAXON_ID=186043 /ORGANISM="Entomoneis sp., Strain CCMP2396" /LENGTH=290 /DNA_ID=CAMNT_0043806629 /DNA_START=121 /DNA_END=993 /DNA_ORIENTATION=+
MISVLVTGANSGIGLALCKQLAKDHGAKVFLGSRSVEKGQAAVQEVLDMAPGSIVEMVQIDVSSDDSVQAAAKSLFEKGVKLNAIVNNAGRGLGHGATTDEVLNVNVMGAKRVVDAFLPILVEQPDGGFFARIVNVGSGLGPKYVASQTSEERKKLFCNPDISWDDIEKIYSDGLTEENKNKEFATYGLSKALLASYTLYLAKTLGDDQNKILSFCLSPGYIDTNLTKGFPGGKSPPSEGTVSIRHSLFNAEPSCNGWFYGSDALRSPLHTGRNPGEPEFDGIHPWDKEN